MREVWMRRVAVRRGVAGAFKERGLECWKVWTLRCSAEKSGGPATEKRREGLGRARCQWGMTGIKDGLGILTSIMRSDGIQFLEKK